MKDVFIVDGLKECFVWIGKDASPIERKQAMSYAHVRILPFCSFLLLTASYCSLLLFTAVLFFSLLFPGFHRSILLFIALYCTFPFCSILLFNALFVSSLLFSAL